jgi:hypothetical protein
MIPFAIDPSDERIAIPPFTIPATVDYHLVAVVLGAKLRIP